MLKDVMLYTRIIITSCKDVSFLLRKSSKHKCYPCLKRCVSFLTEHALNTHLDLCNTRKHVGRRTFYKDEYLKFDKFHYKNRVPFAMYYDFECLIKKQKTHSYYLWFIYKN